MQWLRTAIMYVFLTYLKVSGNCLIQAELGLGCLPVIHVPCVLLQGQQASWVCLSHRDARVQECKENLQGLLRPGLKEHLLISASL